MDRRKVEASLIRKGFTCEQRDHRYYFHKFEGKETGVKTKISLGSNYKRFDESLQSKIKKQLKLDTSKELRDLVNCPMSKEQYINKLKEKGHIPRD